jgi:acyl-CoA oxidase
VHPLVSCENAQALLTLEKAPLRAQKQTTMLAALPAPPTAGFASPPRDAEDGPWATSFASRVANLRSEGVTYEDSAAFLRALTKSGILRFTDIRDRPDRFFLAHRLLAKHAPEHGPGFWIRFTVQFNLFAGTVVALGGPAHLKQLDAIQDAGQLGCFGLTERLAGVNSGLVVDTTATWDASTQCFIINSPSEGAAKNWISQGLCAEKAVCVADLTVGKKRCGPHAFLIDMRNNSTLELTPGITVGDMGRKTTGNDLDNAWVRFDSLRVPKSALLNRYGDVINGESIFQSLYGCTGNWTEIVFFLFIRRVRADDQGGADDGHDRPTAVHRSRRRRAGGAHVHA